MWFSSFADEIKKKTGIQIHIFAGGGSGYGTLQNVLLAKKLKNQLDIDAFILQFNNNDFKNNSYELEKFNAPRSQKLRRPYGRYLNNKLLTFYDNSFSSKIYRFLFKHSKLFGYLDYLFEKFQLQYFNKSQVNYTKIQIEDSIKLTREHLKQFNSIFPKKPIFLINFSERSRLDPNFGVWKKIGKEAGFDLIEKPSKARTKWLSGKTNNNQNLLKFIYKDGSHLSKFGNIEFGRIIANEFIEKSFLKKIK